MLSDSHTKENSKTVILHFYL